MQMRCYLMDAIHIVLIKRRELDLQRASLRHPAWFTPYTGRPEFWLQSNRTEPSFTLKFHSAS